MTIGIAPFPDTQFDWVYANKHDHKYIIKNLTPTKFYKKYVHFNCDDYMTFMHDPRKRHPYYTLYTKKHSIDMEDGENPLTLNIPIRDMKELVVRQLLSNQPIWFSCDIGKYTSHSHNLMDIELFNYGLPFGVSFSKMSKADRLDYSDSYASHVMAFTGVDIKGHHNKFNNKRCPDNKKKADKNSDSDTDGEEDKFVYEVVIHKDFLTKEQRDIFENGRDVIVLPYSDPLGCTRNDNQSDNQSDNQNDNRKRKREECDVGANKRLKVENRILDRL
jgi:bleomycin hydrolase